MKTVGSVNKHKIMTTIMTMLEAQRPNFLRAARKHVLEGATEGDAAWDLTVAK